MAHRKIKGYVYLGSRYISLVFLFWLAAALIAAALVYALGIHPSVMQWRYGRHPEFSLLSPYLAGYSGRARLLGEDGTLVYEGFVENGTVEGEGRLYEDGALLYAGGFVGNQFAGEGTLYARDGSVRYRGGFDANLCHGQGTLYENGVLLYRGGFSGGLYEGTGTLYSGGSARYEGGFSAGLFDGEGTEYNPETGHPVFAGKFLNGERMEAGVEYGADGNPLASPEPSPEPSPFPEETPEPLPPSRLNPLTLFGFAYIDVLSALAEDGTAYKEQVLEERHLVADEENGVLYAFPFGGDGQPGTLTEVYLCGLASAGGLVVGADIDGTGLKETPAGAAEQFALGLSNAYWGRGVRAGDMRGVLTGAERYGVAAFWLPPESRGSDVNPPEGEDAPPEAGVILFLRVSPPPETGK
ncbi:MAG: hypothetical protein LBR76_02270 [Oscillospiraceae bacterium]|jgi:hypothetical protein|nr:hypothetical protein [Oscillospiraceae bacterium]